MVLIMAATVQKLATIINDILQLSSIVEVRKLVRSAPPMLPAFPEEQKSPIMIPRPLLPNQFPKIAEQAGQPMD